MKNEQEKIEQILKEELKKEAGQILAEVDADDSLRQIPYPEDLDRRITAMMDRRDEEMAAYENLSEEDKEALRLGREVMAMREKEAGGSGKQELAGISSEVAEVTSEYINAGEKPFSSEMEKTNKKRIVIVQKRRWRLFLLVAIIVVFGLGASMVSVGETPLMVYISRYVIGNRELVKVNSKRDNNEYIISDGEEIKAYEEIKEKFGTDVVSIQDRPSGMEFLGSEIDIDLKRACLLYQVYDSIIEYRIIFNYREQSMSYDIEDPLISEKDVVVSDVSINIKTYEIKEKGILNVAQFNYENNYYILSALLDENDFTRIIKNLKFL